MEAFESLYLKVTGWLATLNWLPSLLARITIGIVFIESGWGKLHNLPKVIEFFQSLDIPAAQFQAPLVAGTEFVAGILVLIGLLTRIASIPLIIIMLVALATAKRGDITELTDIFGFSEYLYVVLLFWLLVSGAGAASVDAVFSRLRGPVYMY